MRFDRMKSLSAAPERAPSPKINDRRVSKPLIEKKRRARINASLAELKTLLEVVLGEEVPRESKMEKADILELAVKHLRDVNRRQLNVAASADRTVLDKYRVGYSECATEIGRYLHTVDGVEVELRARLLGHLSNCIQGMKHDQDCRPRPFMSMIPNPAAIQQNRPHPQYQNIVSTPVMQQQQPIKTSPVSSMQKLPVQQPISAHRVMHLNSLQNGPLPAVPHGQETVPGGVLLIAQQAPERLSPIYVRTVSPSNVMSTEHFMQSARVQRSPDFIKAKQISPAPVKTESGLLQIDVATLQKQKSLSPVHHFVQNTPVPDAKVWRPW